MKVLLFCPTYRLEPETVDSIMRLDPAGHELDIVFTRHNGSKVGSINIMRNYHKGRQIALDGGYDAMLTVESDMIVPSDALAKLAQVDADIACGFYVYRHQTPGAPPCWSPLHWTETTTEPEFWINWQPDGLDAWGKVIRVSGGGLGCTLIYRHVLERVDFRIVVMAGRIITDCDTWLFHDAMKTGHVIKCDLTTICGHKRPDGVVIWPTPTGADYQPTSTLSPYHLSEVSQ